MGSMFDSNEAVNQAKNEIVDRKFNVALKHGMLMIGGAAVGAVSGGLIGNGLDVFPAGPINGALIGGVGGAMAGGVVGGMLTLKESERLKIDEELLASRTQGKHNWGGYREEVMEGGRSENLPLPLLPHGRNGGWSRG